MASVAPEVVVAGTVVAAPQGGVVVGTVVGATGHPALLALPPGVEYVREGTGKNKSELQTAPLLPTDAVVDVVALDRAMFACLLYTSPSPRDQRGSRMPSSA